MRDWIANKSILITGACGTVGSELIRQVLQDKPRKIICIDNNETEIFFLSEKYRNDSIIQLFFADVRDLDSLSQHMTDIDLVFHTAAMKHVVVSERSPRDAIRTNIIGVQNVIDAAFFKKVKKVIFTSSDKAVNPTNVMGTSKLMGERLMTAASAISQEKGPIFGSTRFGNVLGSRGSVIPVFKDQIAAGGPVTITDNRMTRFIMSLEQSVSLVLDSAVLVKGGEVFVTKMPVIRITDLAEVMIQQLAPKHGYEPHQIKTEMIGNKAGEKFYEELMNEEEIRRSIELDQYFVIKPAFRSVYSHVDYKYPRMIGNSVNVAYNSATAHPLNIEELQAFLVKNELI